MLTAMRALNASGPLAALSVAVAIGAVAAYVLLLRVPVVRNHPEGYVVAFALATALAALIAWALLRLESGGEGRRGGRTAPRHQPRLV
jgi:hypothetical protein